MVCVAIDSEIVSDEYQLEVGRLVVFQVCHSALILLLLEERGIGEAVFDGLEDAGLLFLRSKELERFSEKP